MPVKYKIYIKAKTDFVQYSGNYFLIALEIKIRFRYPNTPPFFDDPLKDFVISLPVSNETRRVSKDYPRLTFTFPKITDLQLNKYSLTIEKGLSEFMEFDPETNKIYINVANLPTSKFGQYKIKVLLQDELGAYWREQFNININ